MVYLRYLILMLLEIAVGLEIVEDRRDKPVPVGSSVYLSGISCQITHLIPFSHHQYAIHLPLVVRRDMRKHIRESQLTQRMGLIIERIVQLWRWLNVCM